jgi:starvation-inducible DNA-binding protein
MSKKSTNSDVSVIDSMNILLSTLMVFQANSKAYHWLITGDEFFVLHSKFEELYNFLSDNADKIAERILALRGRPLIGLTSYLKHSQIKETPAPEDDEEIIEEILSSLEEVVQVCKKVKEACKITEDQETEDQMIEFIFEMQKMMWMYRAYLA